MLDVPLGRQSIPFVERIPISISRSQSDRLARIAVQLSADEPALSSTSFLGVQVETGLFGGRAVVIGDNREIALASELDAKSFEYRISHLAGHGDILLHGDDRNAAFESYRQNSLSLETIGVIILPSHRFANLNPLAKSGDN